jgi:hypothetical protein
VGFATRPVRQTTMPRSPSDEVRTRIPGLAGRRLDTRDVATACAAIQRGELVGRHPRSTWARCLPWRAQLKKVINRVSAELQSLGLTSEVLSDLLSSPSHSPAKTGPGKSITIGKGKRKARAQYELDGAPASAVLGREC